MLRTGANERLAGYSAQAPSGGARKGWRDADDRNSGRDHGKRTARWERRPRGRHGLSPERKLVRRWPRRLRRLRASRRVRQRGNQLAIGGRKGRRWSRPRHWTDELRVLCLLQEPAVAATDRNEAPWSNPRGLRSTRGPTPQARAVPPAAH